MVIVEMVVLVVVIEKWCGWLWWRATLISGVNEGPFAGKWAMMGSYSAENDRIERIMAPPFQVNCTRG